MKSAYTRDDLITNFIQLGLEKNNTVFIHSSFKSLGQVEGGADTVISALENVIGKDGLILMPSFNLLPTLEERVQTWNVDTTPSTVGWLTEFFRQMPGTYRSDNYSHSVAARGNGAEAFVADHLSTDGYQSRWDYPPWGKTYGTHSPMFRAYRANGKLLMLGVDYHTSTYIHLVEVIYFNKRLTKNPDATFISLNRPVLGAFWDSLGNLNRGKVGDSDCRLFHIKTYVDTLLKEVEKNPKQYIS
ncbi:MAG: AAC(3) family N-acetyltransferase [Candidatus Poribacteria bacterium]|nr:AAC(3) family N-acetyltransferase [Candidatus Poribacteria bacterium]